MSTLAYVKNLIKDRHIASITPTSSIGVKNICNKIAFTKDNIIVEYGPATGVFTNYILNKMTPDSKIVLIERNENFCSILKKKFPDPRVIIHHDSAENVADLVSPLSEDGVDYVLSGIPFSLFDPQMRKDIVRETHRIIRKNGKFLPYQTFFQHDSHLLDHMKDYFSSVKNDYYLWNMPPMRLYEAVK